MKSQSVILPSCSRTFTVAQVDLAPMKTCMQTAFSAKSLLVKQYKYEYTAVTITRSKGDVNAIVRRCLSLHAYDHG
jgi:hypothetical protein